MSGLTGNVRMMSDTYREYPIIRLYVCRKRLTVPEADFASYQYTMSMQPP